MPAKKVVFTYDFTDETYMEYYGKYPELFSMHSTNRDRNKFDQLLFKNLHESGVAAEMLTHEENQDIPSTLTSLDEKLGKADMVFHVTPRIAFEKEDSIWKTDYQKSIEDLVISKFLGKSHFSSNDVNFFTKQNVRKIATPSGIPMPPSFTVEDYLASERQLPVILKRDDLSDGEGIYFIDKPEQIDRFFDQSLYSRKDVEHILPKRTYYLFEVQEFIETPSNHYTHYRIFTLGDGTILGAILSVSANTKDKPKRIVEPVPFVWGSICIDSPLYMGFIKVVSNHAQGGTQIPLNPGSDSKPLTAEDAEVLKAHGLDQTKPTLPSDLKNLAEKAGILFSNYGALYSGQDWIQDKTGNFYFLELNHDPGLEIFNTLYNRGKGDHETAMAIGTRKLAGALKDYNNPNLSPD